MSDSSANAIHIWRHPGEQLRPTTTGMKRVPLRPLLIEAFFPDVVFHTYSCAPTWVFMGTYLLIWTLFGGLAYLGAFATPMSGMGM